MKSTCQLLLIIFIWFAPRLGNAQCRASFSVANDTTVCASSPLRNFADSSLIYTSAKIVKEVWTWGDGLADTITDNFSLLRSHSYIKGGSMTMSLSILTEGGCEDTVYRNIAVRVYPVADFIIEQDTVCTTPTTVHFVNTTQILNPATTNPYYWQFDNVDFSYSVSPNYTFNSPGFHTVSLIARNNHTCRDTIVKQVAIAGKPKANFTYDAVSIGSKSIQFNEGTNNSFVPLKTWFWDFGDGSTSTEANPIHTYASHDSFFVTHYSTSSFGCLSDTIVSKIYVDSAIFTTSGYQGNSGNEFWAGFGYQEKMSNKAGTTTEAKLSIYIAAGDKPAKVNISLPGIPGAAGFPKHVLIPANSVAEVSGFPTGDPANQYNPNGLPDARLYFTGITERGIHITSTTPVAAWEHIYTTGNTAGATLLLPVNAWGNDYFVQSMGGTSNNSNPNSFFFVIAQEDSTIIAFTPTSDILDSSAATLFTSLHTPANVKYHAGVTYQVLLHKGQVFNCMGFIATYTGVDLSGTRVSTANPLKKIAVFGGNGRVIINTVACNNTSGSDNLVQQMFPKSSWGKKYLTAPIKTMEYGIYRITVYDTTTQVKVNNAILPQSSLKKSSFYQIESNQPNLIEADKRIMVTQYVTTATCPTAALGNNGQGDPEMINLTPLKYSLNEATTYITNFKTLSTVTGAAFINVILKKEAVPSFYLNGGSHVDTGTNSFVASNPYGSSVAIPIANAFRPHPQDTAYYFARIKVPLNSVQHLKADSAFTAIAYGIASAESFGYNLGYNFSASQVQYEYLGTGNWTEASNWLDNKLPPGILPIGSQVIISGNCTLDRPQVIEDGAIIIVKPGAHFIINGNLTIQQ